MFILPLMTGHLFWKATNLGGLYRGVPLYVTCCICLILDAVSCFRRCYLGNMDGVLCMDNWTESSPPYVYHLTLHICVNKLTITGSDNGLSPGRRQAIIWTNAGILLIGSLGTKFNEILIEMHTFLFKKMYLNMSSAKWRPFCLGLNVLRWNAVSIWG